MPLSPGTRLGPYEITEAIGRGGMGEVFRARDTRLNRDVAIKTSAQRFSDRFEREARAIAALNHPNICTLFDVGAAPEAPSYLVMELVDGPTLAERIKEGPLPVAEAENIALQIAQALEAAHEKAITHRDLKPGNVKLREDGSVKVLDFGLAKVGHTPTADVSDNSPTLTVGMTEVGMILGTAAYMAPEQARGKAVDHRADIFAFGVVLHEMLTGRKLFQGEDLTEVLASVVKDQPDLTVVPARMRKLLNACLQKDPRKRLQSIGDAKLLLADEAPAAVAAKTSWLPWAVAAGAIILAGAALWAPWRASAPTEERALSVVLAPPPGNASFFSGQISPDGTRLFQMNGYNLVRQVLNLASGEYRDLPGTEGSRTPFWSPDGRFVAFFKDRKLKVMPSAGGPAQDVCEETGLGEGGSWHPNGTVLFGSEDGPIRLVKIVNGVPDGNCTVVLPLEKDVRRQTFPRWLPDGEHFFYTIAGPKPGVYITAVKNPAPRRVLADNSSVIYAEPAPGESLAQLLFLRGATLMAQPFNLDSLSTQGDPVELAQGVTNTNSAPEVAASISADGRLAYATQSQDSQLTRLDRQGRPMQKVGESVSQSSVSVAPDDSRLMINRPSGGRFLIDMANGNATRFDTKTFSVKWSADSAWVVYGDLAAGGLMRQSAAGGPAEVLVPSKAAIAPSQWTVDNRWLFYTQDGGIWYLPNPGTTGSKPVKFLDTSAVESQAQLSPDGNWVAYTSDESGRTESYVCHFPDCSQKQQISSGAQEPQWSQDGKELFWYHLLGAQYEMMAAPVRLGVAFSYGTPQALFSFRSRIFVIQLNTYAYAPSRDGRSFLIGVQGDDSIPRVHLVTNWRRLLKEPDGR